MYSFLDSAAIQGQLNYVNRRNMPIQRLEKNRMVLVAGRGEVMVDCRLLSGIGQEWTGQLRITSGRHYPNTPQSASRRFLVICPVSKIRRQHKTHREVASSASSILAPGTNQLIL